MGKKQCLKCRRKLEDDELVACSRDECQLKVHVECLGEVNASDWVCGVC